MPVKERVKCSKIREAMTQMTIFLLVPHKQSVYNLGTPDTQCTVHTQQVKCLLASLWQPKMKQINHCVEFHTQVGFKVGS